MYEKFSWIYETDFALYIILDAKKKTVCEKINKLTFVFQAT